MDNPPREAIAKYIEDYQVENNILIGAPGRLAAQMNGPSWSAVERNCINLHKGLVLGTEENAIEWYGREV